MTATMLRWFILIAILVAFQSCNEETLEINNSSEFEDFILEEMELQDIPAMSVLIFNEEEILYEQYAGQSNLSQGIDLAFDHLFLLASVSKVVTATALLQLYEEGRYELDDNINDYLPFNVSVPDQNTPITFRTLLTHTSGIADGSALDDQYYYGEDSPVELAYFLENYLVPGGEFYNADQNFYDFAPGTEYEYSNVGSALIGLLVEEIADQDFNTYCKESIFRPLGMDHTYWRLDEVHEANATIVQPYNYLNGQYEAIEHYTFTDYPNGGLRSTPRDMLRLIRAFIQNGMSNGFELLEPGTIEAMITPQVPTINSEVGLHMFLMNTEHDLWGHDGGEQGVATVLAFNPITLTGAIIFANQGDADLEEILVEAYKFGITF